MSPFINEIYKGGGAPFSFRPPKKHNKRMNYMKIKIDNKQTIKVGLKYIQIEITGFCNMRCAHCRAWGQDKVHMNYENINKIFKLLKRNMDEDFVLGLSGGEPFLHPEMMKILKLAKKKGFERVGITTNASVVNEKMLKQIDDLKFKRIVLQTSLDNIDETEFDNFRNFKGAYKGVFKFLNLIKEYENIQSAVRMTVTPKTLSIMEKLAELVYNNGCNELSYSFVKPVGAATKDIVVSPDERKRILEEVERLTKTYKNKMRISTGDPLKIISNKEVVKQYENVSKNELVIAGCVAGIAAFHIEVNGNITPCSMMKERISNIIENKSIRKIEKEITNSDLVKAFIMKNYKGKCGSCELKQICGGCRAVAKESTNDCLGEDILCFK
ncbi:MAG: radical SAM protein [Methanobrevibacter sp.]|jgi:radical SAM protein with 4Fe4S-binding SPASM domain|nr:radical SAM protein [Methanobrevibacter sp.]